jgi:hypothetical protein
MSSPDKAVATQLANIQAKTGKSMPELAALIQQSGLTKHGEIRAMLQRELGLGWGDANMLALNVLQTDGPSAAEASGATIEDVLDGIYTGAKAALRPIHDRLMAEIDTFGEFETLPKKGYVSLRRKKQFAMIGPTTNTRVEVGLNAKGLPAAERLIGMPAGSMCNYTVRLTQVDGVDDELISWIKVAFDGAG